MPFRVPLKEADYDKTLMSALLDAKDVHGAGKAVVEDPDRKPMTYKTLVLAAHVLGRKLAKTTEPGEAVGVLLPNVSGVAAVFFGLQTTGRVAAMLNFTSGPKNLLSALSIAKIKTVVTARRFVDQAKLDDVVQALSEKATIIYLEDVRAKLSAADKVAGAARATLARRFVGPAKPNDPAVILFTSGTEGTPKGVVLSHRNILANIMQVRAYISLSPDDVLLNPLPVFHSFGLTLGTILPIMLGMKTVLFPSPLRYREVAKMLKDTKASLLVGTDTFAMGYARASDPTDLENLKLVFTGGERVKDETRKAWAGRSNAIVIEGYGATECSPLISGNPFEDNRPGTVGVFMSGIEHKLTPVEGLPADHGRLAVRGPNVMKGYLLASNPGVLQPPEEGWHDTGDIVTVDENGFITIRGRAKRFAKIGGEMVSLAAVESLAAGCWPEATHVALAMPDPKKGEQIILVTDRADADRMVLIDYAQAEGVPELMVPRAIMVQREIPVLGSGKIDYVTTAAMVKELRSVM